MAANQDKLEVGKMFVFGVSGVLFTYAIVLLLQALYYSQHDAEVDSKVTSLPYAEVLEAKAAGQEALSTLGWVDQEAGTVHVPIDDAKSAYLESLR